MFDLAMTPAPLPLPPPPSTVADELLPKLRAFAARVLGRSVQDADVEDCAQEALARALQSKEHDAAYVFGIARNVALDHLRRRARRREALIGAPDSQSDLGRTPSLHPNPEDQSLANERATRVRRALDELPEQQRTALQMYYLEERSYEAIANAMGVPMGTVATWIARGKTKLAASLPRGER